MAAIQGPKPEGRKPGAGPIRLPTPPDWLDGYESVLFWWLSRRLGMLGLKEFDLQRLAVFAYSFGRLENALEKMIAAGGLEFVTDPKPIIAAVRKASSGMRSYPKALELLPDIREKIEDMERLLQDVERFIENETSTSGT